MNSTTYYKPKDKKRIDEAQIYLKHAIKPMLAKKTQIYSLAIPKMIMHEDSIEITYDFSKEEQEILDAMDEMINQCREFYLKDFN